MIKPFLTFLYRPLHFAGFAWHGFKSRLGAKVQLEKDFNINIVVYFVYNIWVFGNSFSLKVRNPVYNKYANFVFKYTLLWNIVSVYKWESEDGQTYRRLHKLNTLNYPPFTWPISFS